MHMKKSYTMIKVAAALVLASSLFVTSCKREELTSKLNEVTESEATTWTVIPGQYIVVYKKDAIGNPQEKLGKNPIALKQYIETTTQEMLGENGISVDKDRISAIYANTINGFCARLNDEQVASLSKDFRVAYIEKDIMLTLARPGGGGGSQPAQTIPYGVRRVNYANYTGSNICWIIDTGIDLDHPDLTVDATKGFNAFTSGKDAGTLDDLNGHGSHCAGIVAARNNTIGVVGVAAGATVVPVKVLDSRGSGSYSGVIAGVDHVAAKASSGDVANMSLGGPTSTALDDAVKNAAAKGIKFAIAAGNDYKNAINYSPARVNGTNIFTISAMDVNDKFASFSNFGTPVDYCAPGVSIYSTYKGGTYATLSGTSMAAPHAAGVLLHGAPSTSGFVTSDPDGVADPIITR